MSSVTSCLRSLHLSFPQGSSPRSLDLRKRRAGIHFVVVCGSIQPMPDTLLYLIHYLSNYIPPSLHLTFLLSPPVIPASSLIIPAKAGIHVLVTDDRRPQVAPSGV
jgi:hypothetical protein